MSQLLRKRVASKAKRHLTAQEGAPVPKVSDPGPEGAPGKQDQPAPGKPPAPGAPPVGGPPGKPPVDKDKVEQDVEDEIREEKEESKKIDRLTDKVEELVDKLDVLVDAQEDVAKVLKKKVLDEDEVHEDLEDFKDEKDEEDEEEFSGDEFGIDTDSLVLGKEEETRMGASKLRKARKARLYKDVKEAKIDKDVDTLSEEFDLDKMKNKKFKPNAPAPTITKVKKSEVPEMLKLAELDFELNASKDKWTVIRVAEDGTETPLYEIEKTEDMGDEFETKDFAKSLISDMQEHGVETVLEHHSAKKVQAQVEEPPAVESAPVQETVEVASEMDSEVEAEASEEVQEEVLGDLRRRFSRAFRLAQRKMAKNLTKKNPLKAAFFENLTALGHSEEEAAKIIEASFSKGADDHLEVALDETDKVLDMSDEAFVELESAIGESETVIPEIEVSDTPQEFSERAMKLRKRASSRSIPLSTSTDVSPVDVADQIQSALPRPENLSRKAVLPKFR